MIKRAKSSHSHLNSIERRMVHFARYNELARLEAYVASDDFVASFTALEPQLRWRAMRAVAKAHMACLSRLPPIPPSGQYAKVTKWKNPENEARLRAAWERHKHSPHPDKGIARDLQIPLSAAKVARWKIIGPIKPRNPSPSAGAAAA